MADAEPRRALRRLHAAHRRGRSALQLRSGDAEDAGRRPERRVARAAGVKTDYSNIAPRFGFSATLPSSIGRARRLRAGVLPGQHAVAVVHEEPAVRRQLRAGDRATAPSGGAADACCLSDGLPPPSGDRRGEPERRDHRRRSGLQVDARAAVQRDRREGVRRQRRLGRATSARAATTCAFVVGRTSTWRRSAAGAVQARRRYFARRCRASRPSACSRATSSRSTTRCSWSSSAGYRAGLTISTNYTLAHNEWTQPTPWDVSSHRAVRRRQRRPPPLRDSRSNYELPFGRVADRCREARCWPAGRSTRVAVLADRAAVQHHQRDRARQHRRRRSAESGRRSRARRTRRSRAGSTPRRSQAQPSQHHRRTAPRNLLHGPSQRRLDLSLFKDVALPGTARLQLRVEVYNVTNTPSFANPNGTLGNAGLRHDHQHRQCDSAADAVRGEAAVLTASLAADEQTLRMATVTTVAIRSDRWWRRRPGSLHRADVRSAGSVGLLGTALAARDGCRYGVVSQLPAQPTLGTSIPSAVARSI